MMLIPQLSLPAGAVALLCAAWGAAMHMSQGRPSDELLSEVVSVIWLAGNAIWMADEVLLDAPDKQTPWRLTPMLEGDHLSLYDSVQTVAVVVFATGAAVYFVALLVGVAHWRRRRTDHAREQVASMMLGVSVASWCLKDMFWALSMLWPAIVADGVTFVTLLVAACAEGGGGLLSLTRSDAAWLLWVASNEVWVLCELAYDDDLNLRWGSASLAGAATLLLCSGYRQAKHRAVHARARKLARQAAPLEPAAPTDDAGAKSPAPGQAVEAGRGSLLGTV